MKTKILFTVILFLHVGIVNVSAQKWLNKAGKLLQKTENATKQVENAANTLDQVDTTTKQAIAWDKIPVFSQQVLEEKDDNNQTILNADGTVRYRVFLVDQFGNKRSTESVKAQIAAVNKAVTKVIGKVGVGAAIGAGTALLSGGNKKDAIKGGLAGGAAGAIYSAEDIAYAQAMKKSLKEQKKMFDAYCKNFTDEGLPVDAKADISKLTGLDLEKTEVVSTTTSKLLAELSSESFNSTDTSAWDF